MAVPDHVRLELGLVGELDPADAAQQAFPARQRPHVLLEVDVFVRRDDFCLQQRQASAIRTDSPRCTDTILPAQLPLGVRLEGVLHVQLVVRRELLDLVQYLRLDFHLGVISFRVISVFSRSPCVLAVAIARRDLRGRFADT